MGIPLHFSQRLSTEGGGQNNMRISNEMMIDTTRDSKENDMEIQVDLSQHSSKSKNALLVPPSNRDLFNIKIEEGANKLYKQNPNSKQQL